MDCKILKNEPLSEHCSFKVGGPVDLFIEIPNERALYVFLNSISTGDYFVLGSGTNVLFADKGYRGTVISLTDEFKKISVFGEEISSGSGTSLSTILMIALQNRLTGFEFAAGIPGTVGGAIYGNAGTKEKWIGSVIKNIEVYKNFNKEFIDREKIEFGYRKSGLSNNVVTRVTFALKKNTRNNNLNVVRDNIVKRLITQPLSMPNAGSIFKNPSDSVYSAGELIEKSDLKGVCVGNAQISKLHGNFIVNTGGALARDIFALIDLMKTKVKEKFNINLEIEVNIINEKF